MGNALMRCNSSEDDALTTHVLSARSTDGIAPEAAPPETSTAAVEASKAGVEASGFQEPQQSGVGWALRTALGAKSCNGIAEELGVQGTSVSSTAVVFRERRRSPGPTELLLVRCAQVLGGISESGRHRARADLLPGGLVGGAG